MNGEKRLKKGRFSYVYLTTLIAFFFLGLWLLQIGIHTGFVTLNGDDKEVTLEQLLAGHSDSLEEGQKMTFNFEEEFYFVRLEWSDGEDAVFLFNLPSDSESVSLSVGQSEKIDLDKDGTKDLEFKFVGVEAVQIKVYIKLISDDSAVGDEPVAVNNKPSLPKNVVSNNISKNNSIWRPGDPELEVKDTSFLGKVSEAYRKDPNVIAIILFGGLAFAGFLAWIFWIISSPGRKMKQRNEDDFFRPEPRSSIGRAPTDKE